MPVIAGLMMPGMVPMVLEMPMRMAAYCGAMSKWLMDVLAVSDLKEPLKDDKDNWSSPSSLSLEEFDYALALAVSLGL